MLPARLLLPRYVLLVSSGWCPARWGLHRACFSRALSRPCFPCSPAAWSARSRPFALPSSADGPAWSKQTNSRRWTAGSPRRCSIPTDRRCRCSRPMVSFRLMMSRCVAGCVPATRGEYPLRMRRDASSALGERVGLLEHERPIRAAVVVLVDVVHRG